TRMRHVRSEEVQQLLSGRPKRKTESLTQNHVWIVELVIRSRDEYSIERVGRKVRIVRFAELGPNIILTTNQRTNPQESQRQATDVHCEDCASRVHGSRKLHCEVSGTTAEVNYLAVLL